jgi:predicted dehydrogenase
MTNRRDFLKKSTVTAAGISIGALGFSARSYKNIIGANERVNVASIGIRNFGYTLIKEICKLKDGQNIQIVTLCDVDEQLFAERHKYVYDQTGIKPRNEWDMRKVFEDKDIDAVFIATPNHWHALATIWACQAGKHVYVEKPVSHNIFEGRKMIDAANKYGVCVQVGLARRANSNNQEAMKLLHDGGIGDVYLARVMCFKQRDSIGIAPDTEAPESLHYDMWLGPADYQPYNEKKLHYNHHWFWNTGNGDIGNQGVHQLDIARWGLNKMYEHPRSAYSVGGLFGYTENKNIEPASTPYGGITYGSNKSMQETPNTMSVLYKYDDGKIIEAEVRGRYSQGEATGRIQIGNIFLGTEGYLEMDGYKHWRAFRKNEKEPFAGSEQKNGNTDLWTGANIANFLNAIRIGDTKDLYSNIHNGHYSATLTHLANISYRLGRELKFVGEYEKFANDPEADLMLTRNYRKNYVVTNEV